MTPEEEAAVDEMQLAYSDEVRRLQQENLFLREELDRVKRAKELMGQFFLYEFRWKQLYKQQRDDYMKRQG